MYRLQSQHLSLVWLVGALIGVTLQSPLFYAFSFLLLPFFYLYLLIGVGLFCFVTVRLAFRHQRSDLFSLTIFIVFAVVVMSPVASVLDYIGDHAVARGRFLLLQSSYEKVVDYASQGEPTVSWPKYGSLAYQVDSGPVRRIAFPYSGGVVDNWQATVYDPTDAVSAAQGWVNVSGTQQFSAPPEIRGIFGGDLVWCYRLSGHYFRCAFT